MRKGWGLRGGGSRGCCCEMPHAKLQPRILYVAEAVQAAKLHQEMPLEQQAIMLSAGEQGTGTTWMAMHKSLTELAQSAQWRMATALRLGATHGDMCEHSLAKHPFHTFCCKFRRARARPHRAVLYTSHKPIEQAGGYAGMERHVPELHDWVKAKREAASVMRCSIMDVVSWFPVVLQQLWIDVSVRCPHSERYDESAWKPGVAAVAGETEKTKRYGAAVRSLAFQTYGRLGEAPRCCGTW